MRRAIMALGVIAVLAIGGGAVYAAGAGLFGQCETFGGARGQTCSRLMTADDHHFDELAVTPDGTVLSIATLRGEAAASVLIESHGDRGCLRRFRRR